MTESSKHFYVFIAVIVFILSDTLLMISSQLEPYFVSKIIKGTVFLFLGFRSLIFFNYTQKLLFVIFTLIFIFSQFLLWKENKLITADLFENIRFFTWYIFVLILSFLFVENKVRCTKKEIQMFNKLGYALIILVSLSIVIGFIFDLEISRSYRNSGLRWGYKGIIGKSVTLSYFFIVSLFFIYYQYLKKNIKGVWFFILLFCSFLSGTKTIYAFVLFLFAFHIIKKKLYLNSFFLIKTGFISLIIFYFKTTILANTEFLWKGFYDLYLEKGFMYSFTSFRSEMLLEGFNNYKEQWNWHSYLIGGRLVNIKYFEMAFFDLIIFWGLIGTILYLYFISRYVLILFIKENKKFGVFIMMSLLLASFFTGQFLINSTAIIVTYYYLLLFRLNDSL